MKIKSITAALAALAICAFPVYAEDPPLAEHMSEMNDAYKAMRRTRDPEQGASLAREAQQAMFKAIAEVPELVKEMPDGSEKAKASAEYRRMVAQLIVIIADVELAFLDGDLDRAGDLFKEMRGSKKDGHDKFMED